MIEQAGVQETMAQIPESVPENKRNYHERLPRYSTRTMSVSTRDSTRSVLTELN